MTDRELLEAAAKAAGIEIEWDGSTQQPVMIDEHGRRIGWWNPLMSDGTALRLAVKLGISVEQDPEVAEVSTAFVVGRIGYNTTESYGPLRDGSQDDPCAATRRAIVRAAAAMAEED